VIAVGQKYESSCSLQSNAQDPEDRELYLQTDGAVKVELQQ
jgi:hypothetical protein